MKLSTLTTLLLTALATAAPNLQKRCRVGWAIQPCFVRWDHSECEMYRPVDLTYTFDEASSEIIIDGICESCSEALVYESKRERPDSWAKTFGDIEDKGNGTFVLTNVPKHYFRLLQNIKVFPYDYGRSCVSLERYQYDWH